MIFGRILVALEYILKGHQHGSKVPFASKMVVTNDPPIIALSYNSPLRPTDGALAHIPLVPDQEGYVSMSFSIGSLRGVN